ncbi:MAG: hypothetical protein ACRC2B_05740, partial [Rubrivivax sp.]
PRSAATPSADQDTPVTLATLLPVFLLALAAIGIAIVAMAVGVIFKRPCLRGSCGGPAVLGPDGQKLSCATCPNRNRGRPEPKTVVDVRR